MFFLIVKDQGFIQPQIHASVTKDLGSEHDPRLLNVARLPLTLLVLDNS